jgi:hypothetical protein
VKVCEFKKEIVVESLWRLPLAIKLLLGESLLLETLFRRNGEPKYTARRVLLLFLSCLLLTARLKS